LTVKAALDTMSTVMASRSQPLLGVGEPAQRSMRSNLKQHDGLHDCPLYRGSYERDQTIGPCSEPGKQYPDCLLPRLQHRAKADRIDRDPQRSALSPGAGASANVHRAGPAASTRSHSRQPAGQETLTNA